MKSIKWLRDELQDAIEFFILPIPTIFLPWRLAYRYIKLVSHLPFYNRGVPASYQNALELGLVAESDKKNWIKSNKISQLVDVCDIYLCWLRGDRFLDKYVHTNFDDKSLVQQLLVSFPHYGTGLWLYRYLNRLGLRSNLLINPLKKVPFFTRPFFRTLSYRLRAFVLTKYCGVNIISPGDMATVRNALRNQEIILVSADMPYQAGVKSYQVKTTLGKLNVTAGFFDLAERRQMPATNMVLGFDIKTGNRQFEMDGVSQLSALEQVQRFGKITETAIYKYSFLWRMLLLKNEVLIND